MEGKDRRDERRRPHGAGRFPEKQEKQDHRQGMKQAVGEVMAGGVQAVQLAIKHVGKPRQRVPVPGGLATGEGPLYPGQRETAGNMRVRIHIDVIIIIDEPIPHRLPENQAYHHRQPSANQRNLPRSNLDPMPEAFSRDGWSCLWEK